MKLLLVGVLSGVASLAWAGDAEMPPQPPTKSPLGQGVAWSVAGEGGVSMSSSSIAMALGETASLGFYPVSDDDHAVALEALENINVVIDHTTPQYGFLGISLRRLARPERPWIGTPGHAVSFQRIAFGPALLGDGNRFDTGFAADLTLGYLTHGANGVALDIGAYTFDSSNVTKSSILIVGVSYVHTRLVDVQPRPRRAWQPAPPPPASDEPDITKGPCRDPSEYQAALREHRQRFVEACAAQAPDCETERAAIAALDDKIKACSTKDEDDAQP